MAKQEKIPRLGRHAPTGQGRVRLSGTDHYLGVWPSDAEDPPTEVKTAYDRLIARWLGGARRPIAKAGKSNASSEPVAVDGDPDAISVAEVVLRYLKHADAYYRDADGVPTSEATCIRGALRPLVYLFGQTAAKDFGPKSLKAVTELLISGYEHPRYGRHRPLSRRGVNGKNSRIKRLFRWAGGEELVPSSVWHTLQCVPGLQRGRTRAGERPPILPVPTSDVEKVLPLLSPSAAGLVRLQTFTGCRPGEAVRCRLDEMDRSRAVWLWRPRRHKNSHRGHERVIAVGPQAQAVILDRVRIRCPLCGIEGRPARIGGRDGATCGPCADRLDEQGVEGPHRREETTPPDEFLFSPARDREERFEDRRANRKTRVQPSQKCRKKSDAKRTPGPAYSRLGLAQAVTRACKVAGVEPWAPNRLRHSFATLARQAFGLEGAQAALGHAKADVTQLYAARDVGLASRIASEIG